MAATKGQRGEPGAIVTRSCSVREKAVGKKERRAAEEREASDQPPHDGKLKRKEYEAKLNELHMELVKMQYWIKAAGKKLVILFEGRDAAGKGGAIKCVAGPLNPRGCRIVALGKPSDTERTHWYFQRYVAHLPAAGEIVLFDRSWYNRAGVDHVMGFCTQEEYREFLRSCPEFERMLVHSGIILLKYWFSVSDEEQERRFHERAGNPARRWKLSEMDIQSREKWVEFSKAKDEMFKHTDIKQAPWYDVEADDKRRARLNCIAHILSMVPYEDATPPPLKLPSRRPPDESYVRPPKSDQNIVPDVEL
jgi:polyphosphate kinase